MPNRIPPHPMQPLVWDDNNVIRFRRNKIVRYLLDAGPFNLTDLADIEPGKEDWCQLMQLIGYSVSGFGEIDCASEDVVAIVDELAEGMAMNREEQQLTETTEPQSERG